MLRERYWKEITITAFRENISCNTFTLSLNGNEELLVDEVNIF